MKIVQLPEEGFLLAGAAHGLVHMETLQCLCMRVNKIKLDPALGIGLGGRAAISHAKMSIANVAQS